MKEIVLASGCLDSAHLPDDAPIVLWEGDAPGTTSLSRFMHENLPRIRKEMRSLAYELGRLKVDGKEVQEHLKCGDTLSMWWCSLIYESHPKVLPELYPLFKLRALEILLEKEGTQSLVLYGGEPLLIETLRRLCAALGLRFTAHPLPDAANRPECGNGLVTGLKKFFVDLYYRLPAPFKAVVRVKWWFLTHKFLFRRVKASIPAVSRASSIVTYFPNLDSSLAKQGIFRSRYWEKLHDLLTPKSGETHRIHWLFIPFPSRDVTLRQCRDFRDAFMRHDGNGASMHFIDEFISWTEVYKAFFRYVRIAVKSLALERSLGEKCSIAGSRLDIFPWLAPAFADSFRGWRCLERCLMRIAMQNYVNWAGKQEWFIFPMENCPWERMLCEAAHKSEAGPAYGVQHSVIRPTDLRYFDDERTFAAKDCLAFQPDKIFCNGRGALDELTAFGLSPDRSEVLEALRYMYLGEVRPITEAVTPTRLLIVTSFFADEVKNHLQMLAKSMHLFNHLEVLIKPHPHLPVDALLAGLFPHGGAPAVCREPVNSLLKPGCILWASNSTTVALEAAISGLPVMVQAAHGDFDLSPAQGLPNVVTVYSLEDIENFLKDPKPAYVAPGYFALDADLPRWREFLQ